MRLSRLITKMPAAFPAAAKQSAEPVDRLAELVGLRDNPGNLRARIYVPEKLKAPAPLVVVLHGCTQSAATYDHGSGWSRLADKRGFILLFPEQRRENNLNLCFNWYQPGDAMRGSGEAASIAAMIAHVDATQAIDRAQVFVTGLSAGGAMASVMLAAYPEFFAAGAIIAGLPYGCATNLHEAFEAMGGRVATSGPALGAAVRRASSHPGPWPRVSVWHGTADNLVVPGNADAIVRQWSAVHGLPDAPSESDVVDGYPHRIWRGGDGSAAIEEYVVTGMGHGTPLAPGRAAGRSGKAGAHMLDVGLSSTDRIAAFFGLARTVTPAAKARSKAAAKARPAPRKRTRRKTTPASGVQNVIEQALRAAGLMR